MCTYCTPALYSGACSETRARAVLIWLRTWRSHLEALRVVWFGKEAIGTVERVIALAACDATTKV